MKTRKLGYLGKSVVAGFAALMMLAESVTAFACPVELPETEGVCTCDTEEHEGCGEVILYDEQFVDVEGNIRPAHVVSGRVFCLGHKIVDGYFQTHVKNDDGGCTVKTYKSTQCAYCYTIWVGDLYATSRYVKCPH